MAKLYQMVQKDLKTGIYTVIYGHVTENVIDQYWAAYANTESVVIIQELTENHVCEHCVNANGERL